MRLIIIVLTGTNLKPTSSYIKLLKETLASSININIGFNIISINKYIGSIYIIINTLYQVADLILLQLYLFLRDTLQKIKQVTDIISTVKLYLKQKSIRQQF